MAGSSKTSCPLNSQVNPIVFTKEKFKATRLLIPMQLLFGYAENFRFRSDKPNSHSCGGLLENGFLIMILSNFELNLMWDPLDGIGRTLYECVHLYKEITLV